MAGRRGADRKHAGRIGARELRSPAALSSCPSWRETSVRIVHNLIAPPGVPFGKIRRVYSHPVALNQCLHFFAATSADRARAVLRYGGQREDDHGGAAAGRRRDRLARGGGDLWRAHSAPLDRRRPAEFHALFPAAHARNICAAIRCPPDAAKQWKTSLVFTTRNIPGALFRSLSAFALRDLNLTEDRIPPAARQALGISLLSGFCGPRGRSQRAKCAKSFARTGGFIADSGVLSEGALKGFPTADPRGWAR